MHAHLRISAPIAALFLAAGMATAGEVPPLQDRIVDGALPDSLTGRPGDAARGRAIIAGRQGNCLSCHAVPIPEESFHGTLGPDLAGVGARLSEGELRLRLVDSTLLNPDTVMPPMFRTEDLHRVRRDRRGQPILQAGELEDVLAYLMTLKDAAAGEERK